MASPKTARSDAQALDIDHLIETMVIIVILAVMSVVFYSQFNMSNKTDDIRDEASTNQEAIRDQASTSTQTPSEPTPPPSTTPSPQDGFAMPWEILGFGTAGVLLLGGTGAAGTQVVRAQRRRRTTTENVTARWNTALSQHDTLKEEYATICGDPLAVLDYMALFDINDPYTEKFTLAMGQCGDLRSIQGTRTPTDPDIVDAYTTQVQTCATKWASARTHARTHGLSVLSPSGQNAAKQARKFLAVALNNAATDTERAEAAKRATALLNSITDIDLPHQTMSALAAPTHKAILAKNTTRVTVNA